jgi:hypothetical protein
MPHPDEPVQDEPTQVPVEAEQFAVHSDQREDSRVKAQFFELDGAAYSLVFLAMKFDIPGTVKAIRPCSGE